MYSNFFNFQVTEYSNNNAVTAGIVYRNITIENATRAYAGNYTCLATATNHCGERGRSFVKKFLGNHTITKAGLNNLD